MLQAWAARTELRAPRRGKAPDCPRCNSAGIRFCGYRLRQPRRYFCKACGRYWTEEYCPLILRPSSVVVPVGGGSREKRTGGGARSLPLFRSRNC